MAHMVLGDKLLRGGGDGRGEEEEGGWRGAYSVPGCTITCV